MMATEYPDSASLMAAYYQHVCQRFALTLKLHCSTTYQYDRVRKPKNRFSRNLPPAIAGCWWCLSIYDAPLKPNLLLISLQKIVLFVAPKFKYYFEKSVRYIDKAQRNDYTAWLNSSTVVH